MAAVIIPFPTWPKLRCYRVGFELSGFTDQHKPQWTVCTVWAENQREAVRQAAREVGEGYLLKYAVREAWATRRRDGSGGE